jgi:hypothetical protein
MSIAKAELKRPTGVGCVPSRAAFLRNDRLTTNQGCSEQAYRYLKDQEHKNVAFTPVGSENSVSSENLDFSTSSAKVSPVPLDALFALLRPALRLPIPFPARARESGAPTSTRRAKNGRCTN